MTDPDAAGGGGEYQVVVGKFLITSSASLKTLKSSLSTMEVLAPLSH